MCQFCITDGDDLTQEPPTKKQKVQLLSDATGPSIKVSGYKQYIHYAQLVGDILYYLYQG